MDIYEAFEAIKEATKDADELLNVDASVRQVILEELIHRLQSTIGKVDEREHTVIVANNRDLKFSGRAEEVEAWRAGFTEAWGYWTAYAVYFELESAK